MKLSIAKARKLGIYVPPDARSPGKPKVKVKVKTAGTAIFAELCQKHGLPVPVPEHKFCPGRKWAFDWSWPDLMLAAEIEGGLFGRGKKCPTCGRRAPGAHSSIDRLLRDKDKYNESQILGWTLLRFLPQEIKDGSAFPVIRRAMGLKEGKT